jgi:hypothetical protein
MRVGSTKRVALVVGARARGLAVRGVEAARSVTAHGTVGVVGATHGVGKRVSGGIGVTRGAGGVDGAV